MAVFLTEGFLRDSLTKFTGGERGADPVALSALLIYLMKASQSPQSLERAKVDLQNDGLISQFIDEVREEGSKQQKELLEQLTEKSQQIIAQKIRSEIEPGLRGELETKIRQEFVLAGKNELKANTDEIIRLVKEMDSKFSGHSDTTHGKLQKAEIRAERLGEQLGKAHTKLDTTTEQLTKAAAEIAQLKSELEKSGIKGKRDFRVGTAIGIIGLIIGVIGLKPMIVDFFSNNTDEADSAGKKQQAAKTEAPHTESTKDAPQPDTQKGSERSGGVTKEQPEPSNVVPLFKKEKHAATLPKHKAKIKSQRPNGQCSRKLRVQKQHRL